MLSLFFIPCAVNKSVLGSGIAWFIKPTTSLGKEKVHFRCGMRPISTFSILTTGSFRPYKKKIDHTNHAINRFVFLTYQPCWPFLTMFNGWISTVTFEPWLLFFCSFSFEDSRGDPSRKKVEFRTLSFLYQFLSICTTQTSFDSHPCPVMMSHQPLRLNRNNRYIPTMPNVSFLTQH